MKNNRIRILFILIITSFFVYLVKFKFKGEKSKLEFTEVNIIEVKEVVLEQLNNKDLNIDSLWNVELILTNNKKYLCHIKFYKGSDTLYMDYDYLNNVVFNINSHE